MRRLTLAAALLGVLVVGGCAQSDVPPSVTGPSNVSAPPVASEPVPAADMPLLVPAAVPGVPSVTTELTVAELGKDASIRGLAAKVRAWGFEAGLQRTFQGESRHLTYVLSRSLYFRDASGARQYVAFVHGHAGAFFGGFTQSRPLLAGGRRGWQLTPPACACHLANPVDVGLLTSGPNVVWLEINGPDATPALLLRLLDPARSAPATSMG